MHVIVKLSYLLASVLFILGLKLLSSPKTARRGNLYGALGMLLAVVVTLTDQKIIDFTYIFAGLLLGSAVGVWLAKKIEMTAMPQMVGVLNGFGGGASALVAYAEYLRMGETAGAVSLDVYITIVLGLLIGSVTFVGSMVAAAKLQGTMRSAPILYPMQKQINAALLLIIIVLGALFVLDPSRNFALVIIIALAAVLGVTSVIPIGGADMPVVISLMNSYSGLAGAMTGFIISNDVLIISGTLVGTSGLILTDIMCKAMNRSLGNVLFAGVGADYQAATTQTEKRTVVRYTAADAAMIFDSAQSVIIVPGYGLAVAQAQHVLQELAKMLMERGVTVRYAIHPVAGRMPGHMNVLLAEANVPYDLLVEMDQINDDFQNTDVALVIGANDVINPAARTKKDSPLYGMPILNVDYARTVMIVKRSLGSGFAGEDNELFYDQKTMMLFGDAKQMVTDLVRALKE
ncbi:NAD(P)(+) transhydrogenase (Re/Si-specific) subunit beta [candidate division KSB1 bacterium]|nr:MAG: NAD(P)(+) transhydrogenase (Re/Si-specific) subunit beta [candidate division KSB1 bacterium]MBC6949415.1 NAD(P)(+) transhydrogenase (Re/Si-specific) subunit beta [candidate division KSB1 bacterium]MCE7940912.1 NAD(P)(+) transhydrogenase (Re/Si-specific) subunit beta [Chlorobi bacterium CHB1]MDL1876757.1 NAD(P)(+) transhydrogenase (Re/Si-specific) subunit beta [Cytophagia bacterium CHB2]